MAIKEILVIVDLYGKRTAVEVAADIAARVSAHLTGLSLIYEPMVPGYSMAPLPADFIATAIEGARADARKAVDTASEVARRVGVPFEARMTDLVAGAGFADVMQHCRLADLVVVGQPDPDHPEPLRAPLLDALLYDSGAPVLVIPFIGGRVAKLDKALVAWDGSATAARAVHAALPMLPLAKTVEVLIVESGSRLADEDGSDIARHLARHGLKVEIRKIPRGEISVADALLNFVADNAFDWVAMGAYGHSRFREMVFGGATRNVLAEMTVPVLLAH